MDGFARVERAFEDFLGQGVFERTFDGAAHRTGAVEGVVTAANEEVFGLVVGSEDDIAGLEALHDFADLGLEDADEVGLGERAGEQ